MPNPYGITLDEASIRWAVAEGVSETIITTILLLVLLLHERSVDEVAVKLKLKTDELQNAVRLVSRCPSCYPPGTFDALKARILMSSHGPCVTSYAGPHGAAQLYERWRMALRVRQSGVDLSVGT